MDRIPVGGIQEETMGEISGKVPLDERLRFTIARTRNGHEAKLSDPLRSGCGGGKLGGRFERIYRSIPQPTPAIAF